MKNIIVPTDFSDTSKNAFVFAQQMALGLSANIKLVHALYTKVGVGTTMSTSDAKYLISANKRMLDSFTINNRVRPMENTDVVTELKIEKELLMGLATDVIVQLSKKADTDIIVMGTTGDGSNNILEKIFGTVSIHVARNAWCPVLLIPPTASYGDGFDNVLYASDYSAADEKMIEQVTNLSTVFETNMHLLHVDVDRNTIYEPYNFSFEQMVRKDADDLLFKSLRVKSPSVIKGIDQYAEDNNVDLIVMGNIHKALLEGIFHRSVIKQMVLKAKIPILIMPFDA